MRETYIPLFQDIRNSSLWAYDSDVRIVWFALLTLADPEGYVCAAVPGLAIAANVPLSKAREAIALFESPDQDSRSVEHEGRRLERVPRGWRILNYGAMLDRARHEAEKARKRRWINAQRRSSRAEGVDAESTASSEPVDASKSKSKSKSLPSEREGNSPQPTWHDLKGWSLSAELRAEAIVAGVPAEDIDGRVADLAGGPIGGTRGTFDRDDYVRRQFPKWRTWAETDRAKAKAATVIPIGRGGRGAPSWEPNAKHRAYATKHKLPIAELAADYIRTGEPQERSIADADRAFGHRLHHTVKLRAAVVKLGFVTP